MIQPSGSTPNTDSPDDSIDDLAARQSDAAEGVIRHGFGLKTEVQASLLADYHSPTIEKMLAHDYELRVGALTLRLARAFGFCYGVDKAIDYAYETRRRFPDRRIFLANEIIHNPQVNRRLLETGIRILAGQYSDGTTLDQITADDVVILPAFGADTHLLARLRGIGCLLVDTTCGSVVHVWKRVEKYAREGFTSVIHGKWAHEETVATCSHVTAEGGHYLVVRDREEARLACDFIRTGQGAPLLAEKLAKSISRGFDFARHLERIGIANQTTMLSSESQAIDAMFRQAMGQRWGEPALEDHFRSFDTICNATQERQDAVLEMMRRPPELMLVVGGFNSSNTTHLCKIAARHCVTYHVDDAACLISPGEIRHRPSWAHAQPIVTRDWLPPRRPLTIGLTAGASTPNKVVGEVIDRLAGWETQP